MMNKQDLREKLRGMPPAEALALAEAEISFWDVRRIHKLASFRKAALFLLSWTPVEASALLKQMEPLAAGLLLFRLREVACDPERALDFVRQLQVPEAQERESADKFAEIVRLCREFAAIEGES